MVIKIPPNGTYGKNVPSFLKYLMKKTNYPSYRILGKHLKAAGRPVLLLITIGSKSRKIRHTPIAWFPDTDNSWFIIASNGGSTRHPSWFFNLAKNPDMVSIKLHGTTYHVVPETLEGDERESIFKKIVNDAPNYAKYQQLTDRFIPIIRLTAQ